MRYEISEHGQAWEDYKDQQQYWHPTWPRPVDTPWYPFSTDAMAANSHVLTVQRWLLASASASTSSTNWELCYCTWWTCPIFSPDMYGCQHWYCLVWLCKVTTCSSHSVQRNGNSKGMGIRCAADRRFSQFIGGAVQSITPPLLDRRDDNNNILQGRLHLPSIANLFGNESFHHPITNPWEHMLTNINHIPTGIQQYWSHLNLHSRRLQCR